MRLTTIWNCRSLLVRTLYWPESNSFLTDLHTFLDSYQNGLLLFTCLFLGFRCERCRQQVVLNVPKTILGGRLIRWPAFTSGSTWQKLDFGCFGRLLLQHRTHFSSLTTRSEDGETTKNRFRKAPIFNKSRAHSFRAFSPHLRTNFNGNRLLDFPRSHGLFAVD